MNSLRDEIAGEIGYEKSVDSSVRDPKVWTKEYHDGFIDGLARALEILDEMKGSHGEED